MLRIYLLQLGIVIPHGTKQQSRTIVDEDNLCREMVFLRISKNLFCAIGITACSVIFLCSASVAIIASKPDSKNFAFVILDYEVYWTCRVRIILKYHFQLNVGSSTNRPVYCQIGKSVLEHCEEAFCQVIPFLTSVFILPQQGT